MEHGYPIYPGPPPPQGCIGEVDLKLPMIKALKQVTPPFFNESLPQNADNSERIQLFLWFGTYSWGACSGKTILKTSRGGIALNQLKIAGWLPRQGPMPAHFPTIKVKMCFECTPTEWLSEGPETNLWADEISYLLPLLRLVLQGAEDKSNKSSST